MVAAITFGEIPTVVMLPPLVLVGGHGDTQDPALPFAELASPEATAVVLRASGARAGIALVDDAVAGVDACVNRAAGRGAVDEYVTGVDLHARNPWPPLLESAETGLGHRADRDGADGALVEVEPGGAAGHPHGEAAPW